jgi:tetratricopeptide (TPR) repeat protein
MLLILLDDSWAPKDYITLIGSIIAVVFSSITFAQKLLEQNRGLRKQLTDILEKITDINLESEKSKNNTKGDYPPNYQSLLDDQRRFFVRQAAFIAKQIRQQVSPYEWLIVAWGWLRIGEVEEAEDLFKTAIKFATSSVDRGISNRSYAQFLAEEGRQQLADDYFEKAIHAFSGGGNRMIYYSSTTYDRWSNYLKISNRPEAKLKLRQAISEWRQHSNLERRKAEATRLVKAYQERYPEEEATVASDFYDLIN